MAQFIIYNTYMVQVFLDYRHGKACNAWQKPVFFKCFSTYLL